MSNGTVFVTGGTKNSGLATAKRFAAGGYDVVLTSRSQEDADRVAASLRAEYGIRARGYRMDLSDVSDIERVFSAVQKDFGRLDVLSLIGGDLAMDCRTLNTDEKTFRRVIDTNIVGNFFCCQNAAGIMKKQGGGAIVVLGSVHSLQAVPDRTVYTISKGALLSMVKAMAVDLGNYNIRVNYIAAGAIHTDRWDDKSAEWQEQKRAGYPAGIESSVEDVANAMFYLGTNLSRSVTGAELAVDSGITCCLLPFKKEKEG